jgi:hypothetical protein
MKPTSAQKYFLQAFGAGELTTGCPPVLPLPDAPDCQCKFLTKRKNNPFTFLFYRELKTNAYVTGVRTSVAAHG